jgi:SAM-dependent methyltransferase
LIITFQLALILLGVIIALLGLIWIFVPILTGLPWIPTHHHRIHKALKLAELQPEEILYDLGAGDGRVLILASREFGARAVGIEISPTHCVIAWLRALFAGVLDRVSIQGGNFYKRDLMKADVVYAYLTPAHAARLRPHLEKQLRPGTRVVTVSADLPGWEPSGFDSDDLIFLYHLPPSPGSLETYMMKRETPSSEDKSSVN